MSAESFASSSLKVKTLSRYLMQKKNRC